MEKRTCFLLIIAAAASMALSSCCIWAAGRGIEDRFVTLTGADVDYPVEGKVYRTGDDANARYYMLAPEITFHPCRPIVSYMANIYDDSYNDQHTKGIRRTGKLCWVEVGPGKVCEVVDRNHRTRKIPVKDTCWGYRQEVRALPRGAVVYRECVKIRNRKQIGYYTDLNGRDVWRQREDQKSIVAGVLAAPFTYVTDPVLTVTTSLAWHVLGEPVAGLFDKKPNLEPQKLLPTEIRRQLQRSTILGVEEGPGIAPYGDYVYDASCRYTTELYGNAYDHVQYRNDEKDAITWASELHAFIPKRRPCVLYLHVADAFPADDVLHAMAAPVRAQGYRVTGALIKHGESYEFKSLPE